MNDLTGRLARWSLQLQSYDFKIQYRKGSDYVVADMLSRLPNVDEINVSNLLGFETNEFESV